MASVGIYIAFLLLCLFLNGWVMGRCARAVGSSRGRLGVGVRAVLLITSVNAIVTAGVLYVQPEASPLLLTAIGLLLQFAGSFLVAKSLFALQTKQTFAPFFANIGMGIVEVALLVFVMRPFVVEAFVFPTKSMMPTINPGDRFFVNKLLRPRRLDLVAYWTQSPASDRPAERYVYCKRLIALPGERLRFQDGGIYIDDQPIALPTVLAGHCHATIGRSVGNSGFRYRDGETVTMGPDEYFFVGDNIENSGDSRLQGPSHATDLVGVVDFMYWPPGRVHFVH